MTPEGTPIATPETYEDDDYERHFGDPDEIYDRIVDEQNGVRPW